jgi:hypothetical protein
MKKTVLPLFSVNGCAYKAEHSSLGMKYNTL